MKKYAIMKKGFFTFVVLLVLCCTSAALADAQSDWNQQCVLKVGSTSSVYVWHTSSVASPTDLDAGTLDPVRTLIAGTYIKRSADDAICQAYHMARISYCLNGSVCTGYIETGVITAATARVRLSNGQYVQVPEALMTDSAALNKYLHAHYGMGQAQNQSDDADDTPAATLDDPGEYALFYNYTDPEDESVTTLQAEMICPGFAWCTVIVNGREQVVPTSWLEWPTVADADHLMASVYAPKTGKASIYAGSSDRTKVLGKAPAGRIVLVLKVGTYFTRVWCDGTVGFIQTRALTFHRVVPTDDAGTALISKSGRTDRDIRINIRIRSKANTRIVATPQLGTPVTVLSVSGSWSEIEVGGYHGFVQTKYLIPGDN